MFVGRVLGIAETKYRFSSGYPYTKYEVEVLENLKGADLKLGVIPVWKSGGVAKDRKNVYFVSEDDFLPQEGDVCVFFACTQEDGSLLLAGVNSNNLLMKEDLNEKASAANALKAAKGFPDYKKAVEACKNQVVYKRERSATAPELLAGWEGKPSK